jgi:hypothetical protein
MTTYRIVRDTYLGYEVQARRWWLPLWIQCNWPMANTHGSIKRAEAYIESMKRAREVVKVVR